MYLAGEDCFLKTRSLFVHSHQLYFLIRSSIGEVAILFSVGGLLLKRQRHRCRKRRPPGQVPGLHKQLIELLRLRQSSLRARAQARYDANPCSDNHCWYCGQFVLHDLEGHEKNRSNVVRQWNFYELWKPVSRKSMGIPGVRG